MQRTGFRPVRVFHAMFLFPPLEIWRGLFHCFFFFSFSFEFPPCLSNASPFLTPFCCKAPLNPTYTCSAMPHAARGPPLRVSHAGSPRAAGKQKGARGLGSCSAAPGLPWLRSRLLRCHLISKRFRHGFKAISKQTRSHRGGLPCSGSAGPCQEAAMV